MRLVLLLIASTLILAGCATTQVANINPDALHKLSNVNLAYIYHEVVMDSKSENAFTLSLSPRYNLSEEAFNDLEQELLRRGLTQDDIDLIGEGGVKVGMSELAMLASLGQPLRHNVSEHESGTDTQWIFHNGELCVYTENGVITSIQSEKGSL